MLVSTPKLFCPQLATKEIKLQNNAASGERWLRLSSNMLNLFGFRPGVTFDRRVISPAGGFELRLRPGGHQRVYERQYRRLNGRRESVIDIRAQQFLDSAVPGVTDRVHFTLRNGLIIGRPIAERTFHIRRAQKRFGPPEAFVAMSSGLDAACLTSAGFAMQALLEKRPHERRDGGRDLSETGVVTAIANNAFRFVFNEDIYRVDFQRVRETLQGQPPICLLMVSAQCDDFSSLKGSCLKEAHVRDLSTTRDMAFEILRLVETLEPAVFALENVPQYLNSPECQMLILKLRRWGYEVSARIMDAREFGGLTSRRRLYLVASVFPGFRFPEAADSGKPNIWALIEDQLPYCRDATGTSSVQGGIATGRIMLISKDSAHAPTITKSQSRHTKDSIYILTPEGRYLVPNLTILRRLQGIPDSFSLDFVNKEQAVEILGQGIDWSLHHRIALSIRHHIDVNTGKAPELERDQVSTIASPIPSMLGIISPATQLRLF